MSVVFKALLLPRIAIPMDLFSFFLGVIATSMYLGTKKKKSLEKINRIDENKTIKHSNYNGQQISKDSVSMATRSAVEE